MSAFFRPPMRIRAVRNYYSTLIRKFPALIRAGRRYIFSWLRRLPDAVRTALHKGADLNDGAIDRQRVRAEVLHDLAVEQHRQDAHRHVDEEGREARGSDLVQLQSQTLGLYQAERIPAAEKVRQHHDEGDGRADGGGKPSAVDPHVAGEDTSTSFPSNPRFAWRL